MRIYLRFFRYFRRHLSSLLLANAFMILFVLFNLLSIVLVMPFIDLLFSSPEDVVPQDITFNLINIKEYLTNQLAVLVSNYDKLDILTYVCGLIVLSYILKNSFSYMQTFYMSRVEQGIIQDIQTELYSHLHKLSLSYFSEEKKGNLISRIINDVKIINDSMAAVINSAFRDPPQIILYTLVLFAFNWELTMIIFILLPIIGFILSKIGDSLKRKSIRSQEKIADVTSLLDETLSSMRIVKAFNMEEYEVKRFGSEIGKYYKLIITLIRRRALASPITETIGVFFICIILYFMGSSILSGESDMGAGAFFLYIGLLFQMMPSLKLFGQVFNSVKEGMAASERVFAVMDTKPAIKDSPNAVEIESFENQITFDNVSFRYETSDTILKNVNLNITKGEILAIVGPSGAGKSTLVDLIPRFYDPVDGTIRLDNNDIKKVKVISLRKLIGVVTQETILFNDTIKNNITYGSGKFEIGQIEEVAQAANAFEFISNMEKGFDTIIGDRGIKLSGGQRQRLSIARALLKNPPILILDEATSSLDTESEILVQEAIERLMHGRTSVVIAHRLSTVINANKIIVIDKGSIIEEGKHAELLKLNGLYSKLYNLQFKE